MQFLEKSDVIHYLTENKALKDGCLRRHIDAGELFFRLPIIDVQGFESFIVPYHKGIEVLMPGSILGGRQYTIKEIIDRMVSLDMTFEKLASGTVEGDYNPIWFKVCADLVSNFDYSKLDDFLAVLPTNTEQRDCPLGSFRLIDGTHRSLVLAFLLRVGKIDFRGLNLILVLKKEKMPLIIKG